MSRINLYLDINFNGFFKAIKMFACGSIVNSSKFIMPFEVCIVRIQMKKAIIIAGQKLNLSPVS
ncbi:hypothetical protein ACYT7O_10840, partial [Streptococcus pyogenes]